MSQVAKDDLQLHLDRMFDTLIVVDSIPIIDSVKKDKLSKLLRKLFSKYGQIQSMEMPFEEDKSLGFLFLEYAKPDQAESAAAKMDGHALDASHILRVNKWVDYKCIDKLPETFDSSIQTEMSFRDDLFDWIFDPLSCDQFLTLTDDITEIFANEYGGERPRTVMRRQDFTELYLQWSPTGAYLANMYSNGISLWGGPTFERIGRFEHTGVEWLQFSPRERYLVTYSGESEHDNFVIWDLFIGVKLGTFPKVFGTKIFTPFRWSHDDKYFSRLKDGQIYIYETRSCQLLDNQPLKSHAPIFDFEWSPADNYISFYVPETDTNPARLTVMDIPDRKEIAQNNLFGVLDCKMIWASNGDYLVVKVDIAKTKKHAYVTLKLFRIREKDTPLEALKFDDMIIDFSWEPNGKRFAIIHADENSTQRPDVSFYTMEFKQVKLVTKLEKHQASNLYWSPTGNIIVIASMGNGLFDFYHATDGFMMRQEAHHPNATHCDWDPTGRYFVASSSAWKEKGETGWTMWSATGKELHTNIKGRFYQFLWRPRPPTLLTAADENNIQKNWREITGKFKREDGEKLRQVQDVNFQRRHKVKAAFDKHMEILHKEWLEQAPIRQEMRGGYRSDDESAWYVVEELVEDVIEEQVEILSI